MFLKVNARLVQSQSDESGIYCVIGYVYQTPAGCLVLCADVFWRVVCVCCCVYSCVYAWAKAGVEAELRAVDLEVYVCLNIDGSCACAVHAPIVASHA